MYCESKIAMNKYNLNKNWIYSWARREPTSLLLAMFLRRLHDSLSRISRATSHDVIYMCWETSWTTFTQLTGINLTIPIQITRFLCAKLLLRWLRFCLQHSLTSIGILSMQLVFFYLAIWTSLFYLLLFRLFYSPAYTKFRQTKINRSISISLTFLAFKRKKLFCYYICCNLSWECLRGIFWAL